MKSSNGFRDVHHIGLQSTQTRRNYSSNNTGKQGAQTSMSLGTLQCCVEYMLGYNKLCKRNCLVLDMQCMCQVPLVCVLFVLYYHALYTRPAHS